MERRPDFALCQCTFVQPPPNRCGKTYNIQVSSIPTKVNVFRSFRSSKRSSSQPSSSINTHMAMPQSPGSSEATEFGTVVDEVESDENYFVLDGKEVASLIAELQKSGADSKLGLDDDETDPFLALAEQAADERDALKSKLEIDEGNSLDSQPLMPEVPVDYFCDANMFHMPKWVREAYENGEHKKLEEGSQKLAQEENQRRLEAILEYQNNTSRMEGTREHSEGIVDCTLAGVAEDYNVPVELIVDVLIEYGVPTPLNPSDWIQKKLKKEEIEKLLLLLTSFDSNDLADRYSDKSLRELAEDYELRVEELANLCEEEGIFLAQEHETRLHRTREDRILDILLHDAATGKPYPSILEGFQ